MWIYDDLKFNKCLNMINIIITWVKTVKITSKKDWLLVLILYLYQIQFSIKGIIMKYFVFVTMRVNGVSKALGKYLCLAFKGLGIHIHSNIL